LTATWDFQSREFYVGEVHKMSAKCIAALPNDLRMLIYDHYVKEQFKAKMTVVVEMKVVNYESNQKVKVSGLNNQ